jgi:hypothetical protein
MEDTQNLCLEVLKVRAFEDGTADTDHAGPDFADRHQGWGGRQGNEARDG